MMLSKKVGIFFLSMLFVGFVPQADAMKKIKAAGSGVSGVVRSSVQSVKKSFSTKKAKFALAALCAVGVAYVANPALFDADVVAEFFDNVTGWLNTTCGIAVETTAAAVADATQFTGGNPTGSTIPTWIDSVDGFAADQAQHSASLPINESMVQYIMRFFTTHVCPVFPAAKNAVFRCYARMC